MTNGSITLLTPSTFAAWATRPAIAAAGRAMNGVPSVVLKTTVPLAPAAPGRMVASLSVTCAVGVPGMEMSPAGALPPMVKAVKATARIAIQVAMTARRRRAANRPIR